jgi:hypothetical protein
MLVVAGYAAWGSFVPAGLWAIDRYVGPAAWAVVAIVGVWMVLGAFLGAIEIPEELK